MPNGPGVSSRLPDNHELGQDWPNFHYRPEFMDFTQEQILALAPDASSAKSGKDLSTPRKWVTLGGNDAALWGECQGSGSKPYQTQIDLAGPAFKCSCPSRKFPCKHGLGLFLLAAAQPATLTQKEPPAWVAEWLAGRQEKAETKAKKVETKAEAEKNVDPAAQAKRIAQREAKITAGLDELNRWLRDTIRQGLDAAQQRGFSHFDGIAARMVDAQAPGVARLLRDISTSTAAPDWPGRMLEQLATIHLISRGYANQERLPEPLRQELRALVGWTVSQDALLASEGVVDEWSVLGQLVLEEDRLRVQRTWLFGAKTKRHALALSFSPNPNVPLDKSLMPDTRFEGELVFFPGVPALRAVVKQRTGETRSGAELAALPTFETGQKIFAEMLAQAPWIERAPLAFGPVRLVRKNDDGWGLADEAGYFLPLADTFERGWELTAVSGGQPVTVFGEWDGEALTPLSAWRDGHFIRLVSEG